MIRRAIVLVVLLAGGLAASSAEAETNAARAKRLYEEGSALYQAGEYREAARSLREAYELVERPALLYNIGMAEWRAGELEQAIRSFEQAIRADLPGALHVQAQARLVGITTVGEARINAAAMAQRKPVATVVEAPPLVEPTADAGFGWKGWTGAGVSVVGVGLLASAGFVSLQIADRERELHEAAARRDGEQLAALKHEIEGLQAVGPPLLYAGAGLAALGASLLIWELSVEAEAPRRATFDAVVLRDGVAGTLRLAF